jgi:hypothetical protein
VGTVTVTGVSTASNQALGNGAIALYSNQSMSRNTGDSIKTLIISNQAINKNGMDSVKNAIITNGVNQANKAGQDSLKGFVIVSKTDLDSLVRLATLASAINPQDSTAKVFLFGDTTFVYNPAGRYMLTRVLICDSSAYATQDSVVAEIIRNGNYVKIPMQNLRTGTVDTYMSPGNGNSDFFVPYKICWLKYIRFRRVNTITASGHSTYMEIRSNQ